jgi:hypothetical protein
MINVCRESLGETPGFLESVYGEAIFEMHSDEVDRQARIYSAGFERHGIPVPPLAGGEQLRSF